MTLEQWKSSTNRDTSSTCAAIPGVVMPTQAQAETFAQWTSSAFLDSFRPDPSWSGCSKKVGAIDCLSGRPRVEFKPIEGYAENGGLGWAGPLVIRQRYPLVRAP
jgi:hypothetical protein